MFFFAFVIDKQSITHKKKESKQFTHALEARTSVKMPLQDAQAPVKRDFHAEAIKRVQIEMQNDLDGWNFYMLDEKAKKLQADFSKFEARIVEIACDKGADESTKKKNDDVHKEIEKIFFAVKSVLRKRMAQTNIVSSDENATHPSTHGESNAMQAIDRGKCRKQRQQSKHRKQR